MLSDFIRRVHRHFYDGRARALPLVIYYPTERCNLKCGTCSYGEIASGQGELSLDEVRRMADDFQGLGVSVVMLSGGEPLLRPELPEMIRAFCDRKMKIILLTNGTYLESRCGEIRGMIDQFYISLDGPSPQVHDSIRGVASFDLILRGNKKARQENSLSKISWRMVVQKKNFRSLTEMARLAKACEVEFLSFVAVDTHTQAFGRLATGSVINAQEHLLDAVEIVEFRREIERLFEDPILSGIVLESRQKMFAMADYFERCHRGLALKSPPCSAPMVSLVIDSRGRVLPCFFLESVANIRQTPLQEILNSDRLRQVRLSRRRDEMERCRGCVCSLNAPVAVSRFNVSTLI
ncbi:MAG: radical SAM protein [Elusimicrobia bacterium]|nr:radical SAM protein [Elusimicrobiota bacterium]